MASPSFAPDFASRQRISLAAIDAAVSARLGPTRGLGNSQPACFNRQVAVYLAKNVGRWTTTIIGRFYNGRDHSTVCYGIQRIEALRETDSDVDALITDLRRQLMGQDKNGARGSANTDEHCSLASLGQANLEDLAELIAARVCAYIEGRTRTPHQKSEAGQTLGHYQQPRMHGIRHDFSMACSSVGNY